jgi:wyosine [tRNA(Phe)-imidazoG37] synthetase (radical SAM superfamily)
LLDLTYEEEFIVSQFVTTNHARDLAGLTYIYPVLSRRAGGLSIGVNFNVNNACNWRCIYCQVPNLIRGGAPDLDFALLEQELRFFLSQVLNGNFYQQFNVPESQQVIKDIAISGNGEPTSLKDFTKAVELIGRVATELSVFPNSRYVLITNGSLTHLPRVQQGLQVLNRYGGEVWFKLDSATPEGLKTINHARHNNDTHKQNLLIAAQHCITKIQMCLLNVDDQGLVTEEKTALLNVLKEIKTQSTIQTVLLYTIARPSFQPEAPRLAALSVEVLNEFAEDVKNLGFEVTISV